MVSFRKDLRRHQLARIRECFDDFNRKGGAMVTLQTGEELYCAASGCFSVFGDHPAIVKVTYWKCVRNFR